MHKNVLETVFVVTVVVSLLAATVAAPVTAQPDTIDDVEYDVPWTTGKQHWQGQTALFVPDQPNRSAAEAAGYEIYIGYTNSDGEYDVGDRGSNAPEVPIEYGETANGTPYLLVDTSDLAGSYSIGVNDTAAGQVWTNDDGVAYDRGLRDGDGPSASFGIEELTTTFEDPGRVVVDENRTLILRTNRVERHNLTVSSPNFTRTALNQLLRYAEPDQVGAVTPLVTVGGAVTTIEVSFEAQYVEAGRTYVFDFRSPDTDTTDTATIRTIPAPTPTPNTTGPATLTRTPGSVTTPVNGSSALDADRAKRAQNATDTPGGTATPTPEASTSTASPPEAQPGFHAVSGLLAILVVLVLARRS